MDFNSILIGSEHPERLVEYYTKLLGEPRFTDGGYTGWQLGTGWLTVGPHDQVKGRNAHPGRIIWNLETPDVVGDFERFRTAGAVVIAEPYSFGDDEAPSIATFADPRRQLLPAHGADARGLIPAGRRARAAILEAPTPKWRNRQTRRS